MNLNFELPEKLKDCINEKINYCTPFDIDKFGRYTEGWFVITESEYIVCENDKIMDRRSIHEASNYALNSMVGSGILQADIAGEKSIIIRFSTAHLPRYAYIAKILEDMSKGDKPKINNLERERKSVYKPSKKLFFKRLAKLMKPYLKYIVMVTVLFWIITLLSTIDPILYRYLIDKYLTHLNKDVYGVVLVILTIAVCDISRTLIEVVKNRLMIRTSSSISKDLREEVFSKLHSLSMNYIDSRQTGELMNRITSDTDNIKSFISDQASYGINEILTLIVICIVIFVMNWKMAILVLIPVPFILYSRKWIRETVRGMYHHQWRVNDKCNSILQDILNGIRVVKAFGMEEREVKRFYDASDEYAKVSAKNEKFLNTIFPALSFFMGIGNFFILYIGGKLILKKEMQLGELVQFTQYAGMIYGPLSWLSFLPRAIAQAATSSERVFEILDEEPEISDKDSGIKQDIKGQTSISNLYFGYHSYDPVLKDINIEVKEGEMIGIVGHSGSGKSTLINLIMRLYDVDDGGIYVDGTDIRDIVRQNYHSQIGVVLQETFLFTGTVLQNVLYAKPDASLEEVIRACKIANAHDFIMKLPDGYDTKVGEKGQRLSGGEKQRISIARAILSNPKILILDEATASCDTETEYQIQEALGRLIKNRTTFAIAHRLSTLRNATRLLVIDKGRQIELGTHEELMRKRGKYYSLVMAQRDMSKMG